MRKSATIEILKDDGKTARKVTVYELRVEDVLELYGRVEDDVSMDKLKELGPEWLGKLTDLEAGELPGFTFSELHEIWKAFEEVNEDFFALIGLLGLDVLLKQMRSSIVADLQSLFVSSLAGAMPALGSTGIRSS